MAFKKHILITGGAGFIGSNFCDYILNTGLTKQYKIIILDALTYAGHLLNLESINKKNIIFVKGKIEDSKLVKKIFQDYHIQAVVNFAAESHVDRSISGSTPFIQTNIMGTFNLLEIAKSYWEKLTLKEKDLFRFIQVSTDEVYGSLGDKGKFSENSPYAPNSPYSASKASADMLSRAWYHTYKFPTIITNCSNNYGPRQLPEKLIPLTIKKILEEQNIPVYGEGQNIRDWIYVKDHCEGIYLALIKGNVGNTYCFGGNCEKRNIDLVKNLCSIFDNLKPRKNGKSYSELITFVEDRKGHDYRYAICNNKSKKDLGFVPQHSFKKAIELTAKWYLNNTRWIYAVSKKARIK